MPVEGDVVRGCCALGAFKLVYSGTEHGLEALKYTMSELKKRGFKNIVAFGDVSTKTQVAAFYRGINV